MCGICGVIGNTEPDVNKAVVRQMMCQMCHRGPDDEGMFLDHRVALGMRRLSIIDVDGGQQPVFNEDGSVVVVFNGEIYNFVELRRTLRSLGHSFRTASDTEVIVHAYEEWGEDCVGYLEGMFAFALAETSKSTRRGNPRVMLARDRLGIKPLYYSLVDGVLFFASEVRSLLASGQIEPKLSASALHSYLLFGSVGEPMTLVEGAFSLPPGHRIVISAGAQHSEVHPEPYWDFAESARPVPSVRNPERKDASGFLRSLLEETVESHLMADVPVGVFLSGGIDSTALVALAASKSASIQTVTAVFPEREFNEANIARRTAERFGTEHQELPLTGADMLGHLDNAVASLDQPSMDGINTYFVSWAARRAGLKVVLSGLGSDELFGGYGTFRSTPRVRSVSALAERVPMKVRSVLASAGERIAGSFTGKDACRKAAASWRDPGVLPHPYFYTRLLFTPSQVSALLDSDDVPTTAPLFNWLKESALASAQLDDFTAISCLESRSYMLNTLLRDTDTMSMAHSLEVRVPYLDHPLVEFVSRLPQATKRSNGTPKSLLVEAVGDLLPAEVVSQSKRTFTLPWEYWLRGPLKREIEAEFRAIAPALKPYLNGWAVQRIWKEFLDGQTSWSRVWSLFVLNRWARRHLEN